MGTVLPKDEGVPDREPKSLLNLTSDDEPKKRSFAVAFGADAEGGIRPPDG